MNSGDEVGGSELCRLWIGDSQLFGEGSTGEEVQEGIPINSLSCTFPCICFSYPPDLRLVFILDLLGFLNCKITTVLICGSLCSFGL